MLINVRVNNEKQALKFINDILQDLELEKTEHTHYSGEKLSIAPEVRTEHISEGPSDITIENFLNLAITVGDLDFKTQEIIKKHRHMLHRL